MPRRNKVIGSILIVSTVLAVGTAAVVFYLVGFKDWFERREVLSGSHWEELDRGRLVFVGPIDWGWANAALFELRLPSGEIQLLSDTSELRLWLGTRPVFEPDNSSFVVNSVSPYSGIVRLDGTGKRVTELIDLPCADRQYINVPMKDSIHWSYGAELPRLCQSIEEIDYGRVSRCIYAIRSTDRVDDIRPHMARIESQGLLRTREGSDSMMLFIHRSDTVFKELIMCSPDGTLLNTWPLPNAFYSGLAISSDETWLVTSLGELTAKHNRLMFYNLKSDSTTWPEFGNYEMFKPVFSTDGNRLAVCARIRQPKSRAILISEGPQFSQFKVLCQLGKENPAALAWSPDDKWILVSVGRDLRGFGRPALKLIETATGKSAYVRYSAFFESSVRPQVFPEDDLIWIP